MADASHKNATWSEIFEAERELRAMRLPPLSSEVPLLVDWIRPKFLALPESEREGIIDNLAALVDGEPLATGWSDRHSPSELYISGNIMVAFDQTPAPPASETIRLVRKRVDSHYRELGDPNTLEGRVVHYEMHPDDHLAYSEHVYGIGERVQMPAIRLVCVQTHRDAAKHPDSKWAIHPEDRDCWGLLLEGLQRLHNGELDAEEVRDAWEVIEARNDESANPDVG